MSNPFYNASGAPVTGSAGLSSIMRSEFAAVAAGFNMMPSTLTPNYAVVVNAGGTGLTASNILTSPTIAGTITFPDGATWSATGIANLTKLGIGMTPTNVLDITQTQNAASVVKVLNTSAGAAARTMSQYSNGTAILNVGMFGTGWVSSGMEAASRGFVISTSDLALYSTTNASIIFGTNSTEIGRFNNLGFGIGMTPTYSLDVTKDQNGLSAMRLTNSSTGTAARAYIAIQHPSNLTAIGNYGPNYTGSGIEVANRGFLLSTNDLAIYCTGTSDIIFGCSAVEKARMSNQLGGGYVTGTTNMAVPIATGMDASGGQIYAHRGFYTGPSSGLAWNPGTFMYGTAGVKIFMSIDGTNGVQLLSGANAWAAGTSTRESKKDIEKIPGDPLARIAKMSGYLYRYKAEADDAPLKAGLMWDEVTEAFPWGAVDIPAKEATGDTPAQERVQTIIPDYQIALLVDGVNVLAQQLAAANARIAVLEGKA